MKKRERRQEESGEQWVNSMCELLKGGVLAGFSAVLALLLCALLISMGVLREQWAQGAVLAVCVLGGFAGGIYSIRKIRSRSLLVGTGVGAILFLLLLTAGLLAYDTASLEQGEPAYSAPACAGERSPGYWEESPRKSGKDD